MYLQLQLKTCNNKLTKMSKHSVLGLVFVSLESLDVSLKSLPSQLLGNGTDTKLTTTKHKLKTVNSTKLSLFTHMWS